MTKKWLNRTVLGIGLASLFSDWSHEMATSVLPTFLAGMGVAAAWLGFIEGCSDGLSSFAKMWSGYYTDKLPRRKPVAVLGYLVTALGTASFALATSAWHVLLARSTAWLGRGTRTPIRKALLAASVTKETYGRAFGFERMMDTLGAIVGPVSALALLPLLNHSYPALFIITLVPSLIAVGLIAFVVTEKQRIPVPHLSFSERIGLLPGNYRRFVIGAGVSGLGAFAHTMLILFATQQLTPVMGATKAAGIAVGLYVLHNVFYAAFAYLGGLLADRFPKKHLLAGGYLILTAMCLCCIVLPIGIYTLILIFILGGINVALEETLEDSLCAELVAEEHHGMAFGVLATVNGIGDLVSSIVVGALWSMYGTVAAFGYSAVLSMLGAMLIFSLPKNR
ncbi:MAG: MFS transporter [Verrucomicrobiales bacterium]|jgi:MFS family permease|nr:MFS transporter [Verrucomicrobiales bacterium]